MFVKDGFFIIYIKLYQLFLKKDNILVDITILKLLFDNSYICILNTLYLATKLF